MKDKKKCTCEPIYDGDYVLLDRKCPIHNPKNKPIQELPKEKR